MYELQQISRWLASGELQEFAGLVGHMHYVVLAVNQNRRRSKALDKLVVQFLGLCPDVDRGAQGATFRQSIAVSALCFGQPGPFRYLFFQLQSAGKSARAERHR